MKLFSALLGTRPGVGKRGATTGGDRHAQGGEAVGRLAGAGWGAGAVGGGRGAGCCSTQWRGFEQGPLLAHRWLRGESPGRRCTASKLRGGWGRGLGQGGGGACHFAALRRGEAVAGRVERPKSRPWWEEGACSFRRGPAAGRERRTRCGRAGAVRLRGRRAPRQGRGDLVEAHAPPRGLQGVVGHQVGARSGPHFRRRRARRVRSCCVAQAAPALPGAVIGVG
jgi:hypothetical protein